MAEIRLYLEGLMALAKQKPPADPEVAPKLNDFLCFAIYSTNLAVNRVYKPLLDKLGLTYPQYIVLISLYDQDNQTVGGLGDKLFLDSSTLTPLLKRLETMGHLTRQRDPEDERQVRLRLTPEGRSVREKGAHVSQQLLNSTKLSPAEFREASRGDGEIAELPVGRGGRQAVVASVPRLADYESPLCPKAEISLHRWEMWRCGNNCRLATHSITSSARARSVGGTMRPRALAALRLMTRSNLAGC